jgi:quinol monooxygenase YgiN
MNHDGNSIQPEDSEIMHLLLAELNAKDSHAHEVENILCELVEVARTESGTIQYAVHRQKTDPNTFVIYELYRDAAACEAHLTSAPVKEALHRFESMLRNPPHILFCDLIAATGVA